MLQKCVFLTGLLGSCATMAAQVPAAREFKLEADLKSGWLVVTASAPENHHFNLKAPMVLESTKIPHRVTPAEKSLGEVSFRVPESGATSGMKVSLYVCDDKNTFCEKTSVNAVWTSSRKLVVPSR